MSFSSEVWDRRDDAANHAMSKNLFAFMVAGFTFAGIFASLVAAQFTYDLKFSSGWTMAAFFIGVLVLGIVGTLIATANDNPLISLFGYSLVAIPFGLMLGPVMSMYTDASVIKVLFVTTLLVAVLGIVGAMIPDNLQGWGSWLLGGMLVLLLGYFIVPIAGFIGFDVGGALTLLDWAGVFIFSAMVVYDWNRAMHMPRTLDNAIDIALAVYLDWVNLFIRLLSIMGNKK